MRIGNEWKEIENYMEYPQGNIVIESRRTSPLNIGDAIIYPHLPDQTEGVKLRIFIIGNIYEDGNITSEKTGAYIDIDLEP